MSAEGEAPDDGRPTFHSTQGKFSPPQRTLPMIVGKRLASLLNLIAVDIAKPTVDSSQSIAFPTSTRKGRQGRGERGDGHETHSRYKCWSFTRATSNDQEFLLRGRRIHRPYRSQQLSTTRSGWTRRL